MARDVQTAVEQEVDMPEERNVHKEGQGCRHQEASTPHPQNCTLAYIQHTSINKINVGVNI